MILHCVFCKIAPDAAPDEVNAVFQGLAQLCETLDGALSFQAGPNRDFEEKSKEFKAGFVIHFHDKDALDTYAMHPIHKALGNRLCDLTEGGADGIIVFDIDSRSGT